MKKILSGISVSLLLIIASCSSDKNYTCPCNGQYGTNFSGLYADSLCAAWKITQCPKNFTCTCTLGAPASLISDEDSLQALSSCAFIQSKLQQSYPGTVCNL